MKVGKREENDGDWKVNEERRDRKRLKQKLNKKEKTNVQSQVKTGEREKEIKYRKAMKVHERENVGDWKKINQEKERN